MASKTRRLPVWFAPMAGGMPGIAAIPVTWQGWASGAVLVAAVVAAALFIHRPAILMAVHGLLVVAYLVFVALFTDRNRDSL